MHFKPSLFPEICPYTKDSLCPRYTSKGGTDPGEANKDQLMPHGQAPTPCFAPSRGPLLLPAQGKLRNDRLGQVAFS